MSKLRTVLFAGLALVPAVVSAQEAPSPASPAATFGGFVDSYYGVNLNTSQREPSPLLGFTDAPGLRLSYAELNAMVDAGIAGLRLDLGFGSPTISVGTTNLLVQQAYATAKLGPATVDFGRFVTSAGAEVIESKDNWLYTRSILFYGAIPFAHTGLRVGLPLADGLTLQLGLLNGWDDDVTVPPFEDEAVLSPHKTFNASVFYSKNDTLATVNLYTGKEPAGTGLRTLVDVVLQQTFGPLALNVNFDFGTEDEALPGGERASWWGIAGMAKYAVGGPLSVAARAEYFDDRDGFRLGFDDTQYYEGTLGLSYLVGKNVELRGEVRYTMASEDVLSAESGAGNGVGTFHLAALAWF